MVYVIGVVILDSCIMVWFKGFGVINMRKEDEQAIKRAIAILRMECQVHMSCNSCGFYRKGECILNVPPMHYDIEEIIKCFT